MFSVAARRRFFAKIDEGVLAVGKMDGGETAAADIAAAGMRHRQGIADGHRRIDGVAAGFQTHRRRPGWHNAGN